MKPTGDFFQTLGQYVYCYRGPSGEMLPLLDGHENYIGKGVGDRCLHHIKDKGYSIDDCYIVARNLERFNLEKKDASFVLESYLISTLNPRDNSVSGHYKECFVMASLSSMFTEFVDEQHDNFANLPEWYVNYYDILKGRLREVKINKGSTFLISNARNSIYFMFYQQHGTDEVKVTFEVSQDGDALNHIKAQLSEWLNINGFDEIHPDGKTQKCAVYCENIDAVMTLWKEFWS